MSLSIDEVRKVARLARLKLSAEELSRFSEQLSRVLGYMRDLETLDTKDVAATAHALGLTNVLREDVPAPSDDALREALARNFPGREGPYLKVPKVIE